MNYLLYRKMGLTCGKQTSRYVVEPSVPRRVDYSFGKAVDISSDGKELRPLSPFNAEEFLDALFPHQILEHIGSTRGNLSRSALSANELLSLIAWLELFGPEGPIQRDYYWLWSSTMQQYFGRRVDLKRSLNMASRADVEWVNSTMREFHSLARQEFLDRSRKTIEEFFENVYSVQRNKHTFRVNSKLASSLCEDIFHFASITLGSVQEYTTKSSGILADVASLFFVQLRAKQANSRDKFLYDIESTCAAANDYLRMTENSELLMSEIKEKCKSHDGVESMLDECLTDLIALFSKDAIYAAQYTHAFVFTSISEAIEAKIFSTDWEKSDGKVFVEVIIKTMEDYSVDLEKWLNPFLYKKSIQAMIMATCVFLVECLVEKAGKHKSNIKPYFSDIDAATSRFKEDIIILRNHFDSLSGNMTSLTKIIGKEFEILEALSRCLVFFSEEKERGFTVIEKDMLLIYNDISDKSIVMNLVGDM